MKFFGGSHSKTSSKDANSFAPCFRNAENSENSVISADIVFSMSVFLIISLICVLSVLGITGIIILSLIINTGFIMKKQAVGQAI